MSGIDYAAAKRRSPALKAKITRALNQPAGGPRQAAVLTAVAENILAWDEIGCWPDDWSRWQRALDDAFGWPRGVDVDELASHVRYYGRTSELDFLSGGVA